MIASPSLIIEKETIYFASADQLNDPMEGRRDIVWRGDKIVWENFFRNYVYCLYGSYLLFRTTGDSKELDTGDIPIYGQWGHPPTPKGKRLFDDIWDRFLDLPNIPEIIEALSNTNRKIRYRELRYYLRLMHSRLLNEIVKSSIAHNILRQVKIHLFWSTSTAPDHRPCANANMLKQELACTKGQKQRHR